MTTFKVPIAVGDLHRTRFIAIDDAIVDTGASLPAIPRAILEQLGIQPVRQERFTLADGREAVKDLGWAMLRVQGAEAPCPVIFAEAGAPVLLGAWALEVLFLGVDPVHETLVPVTGLLVSYF